MHVKNINDDIVSKSFVIDVDNANASLYIMNLAENNTNEIRIDEHEPTGQQTFAAKEYRYYGSNPNNYVQFNNELWRIIGEIDVDDGLGNVEKRLKIIRPNPIGAYSWDSSDDYTNKGYGINEWSQADLMTLLNSSGLYFNRRTGTCYYANGNRTKACDFTTTGLTSEAKEMIGYAKWYLGAASKSYSSLTAADFYEHERGTTSGKQCITSTYCDDSVTRRIIWTGQIGLIYPSDYGYSVDMTSCSTTPLASYSLSCKDSTWLYNSTNSSWTLNPIHDTSYASKVFFLSSSGSLSNNDSYGTYSVSPVTYLKSNIQIVDGKGTDQEPFILSK